MRTPNLVIQIVPHPGCVCAHCRVLQIGCLYFGEGFLNLRGGELVLCDLEEARGQLGLTDEDMDEARRVVAAEDYTQETRGFVRPSRVIVVHFVGPGTRHYIVRRDPQAA